MKTGHRYKTNYFGSAGENYCASLFQMARIDNGSSRPDLISVDPSYERPLAIEVKSGRKGKAVIYLGSLLYAALPLGADGNPIILSHDEARDIITNYGINGNSHGPNNAAVYFDVLRRRDNITAKELKHPFSSLKFQWAEQYIVPAKFTFFSFVAEYRQLFPEKSLDQVLREIRTSLISLPIDGWHSDQRSSKEFRNMPINDINYFLTKDSRFLSRGDGQKRVNDMLRACPELEELIALSFAGPNGIPINVLAEKKDLELFERLRNVVAVRNPILEQITEERKIAEKLLEQVKIKWQTEFEGFVDCIVIPKHIYALNDSYSQEELALMNRLQHWLAPGEKPKRLKLPKAVRVVDASTDEEIPF